ncbi:MAG: hypothetical protein Ct9H300mP8_11280 [Gammaproteobacteria bacterium]|nr:MAG: hypothetical protein Ct9H300mP8_11280 [Gammaproteobacteria bacterium]
MRSGPRKSGERKTVIRIDYGDEGDVGEVMTLGEHLSPDKDLSGELVKLENKFCSRA